MNRFFSILTVAVFPAICHSQTFDADTKSQGVLKTTDGKFEGALDVNPSMDQILWSDKNKTRIFGAGQVKEARINTEQGEVVYYGLKLDNDYYLFEALSTGKLKILYREGILKDRYEATTYPPYFLLSKNRELISIHREKDFIRSFDDDSKWMKQYIKNRDLNLSKRNDIVLAFKYYNQQYKLGNPTP